MPLVGHLGSEHGDAPPKMKAKVQNRPFPLRKSEHLWLSRISSRKIEPMPASFELKIDFPTRCGTVRLAAVRGTPLSPQEAGTETFEARAFGSFRKPRRP